MSLRPWRRRRRRHHSAAARAILDSSCERWHHYFFVYVSFLCGDVFSVLFFSCTSEVLCCKVGNWWCGDGCLLLSLFVGAALWLMFVVAVSCCPGTSSMCVEIVKRENLGWSEAGFTKIGITAPFKKNTNNYLQAWK